MDPDIETRSTSSAHTSRKIVSDAEPFSNAFSMTQSFVMLPSAAQLRSSRTLEQHDSSLKGRTVSLEVEPKSIKSSSSTDSFKSAISLQEADLDIARQVKAVQAVLHAFRTALQILHNLIERRMPGKVGVIYIAAKNLQDSLHDQSEEVDRKHIANFKEDGQSYIQRFKITSSKFPPSKAAQIFMYPEVSAKFHDIASTIMRDVVLRLHEISAEHEELQECVFEALYGCSKDCCCRILTYLGQLAPSKTGLFDNEFSMELPIASDTNELPRPYTLEELEQGDVNLDSSPWWDTELKGCLSPRNDIIPGKNPWGIVDPETPLPFIGYTFKRFDTFRSRNAASLSGPTPRDPVPPARHFETLSQPTPPATQAGILRDYQMSLQLLEHQNKIRTMITHQSTDAIRNSESHRRHSMISVDISRPRLEEDQQHSLRMEEIRSESVTEASVTKDCFDASHTIQTMTNEQLKLVKVQLLANFRKNHNLTLGAPKMASFSSSFPVRESRGPDPPEIAKQPPSEFVKPMEHQMRVVTKKQIVLHEHAERLGGEGFQNSISEQNTPVLAGEQILHGGGLLLSSDPCINVLQDFDFDTFLDQDEKASKFNVPVDQKSLTFPAPHNSHSPVDSCDGPEDEPPIYINSKQFHRILRRRAARQALEKEYVARKSPKLPLDALNAPARNNEMRGSAVSPVDSVASSLATPQILNFDSHSGTYQVPVDEHQESRLADPSRERDEGASARFRERRRQKETEARESQMEPPAALSLDPPLQFSTTPAGSYHTPVDIPHLSRSADQKRARNAGASARFRARRKEKEREALERKAATKEIVEGISEQSSGPNQSFTLSSLQQDDLNPNPAPPLAKNSFTRLPQTTSLYSRLSIQQASPWPEECDFLSPSQESKLWWRSFASLKVHNLPAFEVLRFELRNELAIEANFVIDDESLCKQISADIKRLAERSINHQAEGLDRILEMRSNVLRIVRTIDEQLGLQVATLGWSCAVIFLHVSIIVPSLLQRLLNKIKLQAYERVLEADFIRPETIEWTRQSFSQLQDIVGVIARYAVMENLYQKSGSALSLKPAYESALLSLCSKILEYFAVSITLARETRENPKYEHTSEEKQRFVDVCEQLVRTIREMDGECQGFRVVVEAREESRSPSETEIEDVSDDSWEEVGAPSEDGLIDLDAATV